VIRDLLSVVRTCCPLLVDHYYGADSGFRWSGPVLPEVVWGRLKARRLLRGMSTTVGEFAADVITVGQDAVHAVGVSRNADSAELEVAA